MSLIAVNAYLCCVGLLRQLMFIAGDDCAGVICVEKECQTHNYIPLGECCPVCAGKYIFVMLLFLQFESLIIIVVSHLYH